MFTDINCPAEQTFLIFEFIKEVVCQSLTSDDLSYFQVLVLVYIYICSFTSYIVFTLQL